MNEPQMTVARREMNMEKIVKDFKGLSNFLAFLGVLQMLNLMPLLETVKQMDISVLGSVDFAAMGIAASTALTIVKVMCVVPAVLGIVALLYLCVKGHLEARDPSPARFHIILAVICAVCYAVGALETLVGLFSDSTDLLMKLLEVLIAAGTAVLLFFYFNYARKICTED